MKILRRLFEREMAALGRLRSRLRRRRLRSAAPPRRSRPRKERRSGRPGGGGVRAPRPAATRRPRSAPSRARAQTAGSVTISLAVHALLIGILATFVVDRREQPAGTGERWVSIRFRVLPPARPEEETPTVDEPQPEPPEVAKPDPEPAPPAERAEPSPAETIEERAPADLARLADLEAPPLLSSARPAPSVIGAGAATPSAQPPGEGSGLFDGRGRGRARALARHGGGEGTEDAVFRGLRWLAAHQDRDGKWDSDGFNRHCTHAAACFGPGQEEFDVGVTALALLAFLGAGVVPGPDGELNTTTDRGLRFLLRSQAPDGRFGPPSGKYFYNHAIATFAVVEAFGMTRDPIYLDAAARALRHAASAQQRRGGWDYSDPDSGRNDLSITGWQVMAMHAAEQTGVPLPPGMLEKTRRYLDSCIDRKGRAEYADRGIGEGRGGVGMKAVGLLSRLYTGSSIRESAVRGAISSLLRSPPEVEKTYEWDVTYQSHYYWYYGTLALFHVGGKAWEFWNHFLKDVVLPLQNREPHEDGSWAPDGNWIGASGGRIASTAFLVLSLEVYYRYPPLHAYGTK